MDIRPDMASAIAQQGIFAWLLRRLQRRPQFDKNKLYASEILAILLQLDDANKKRLGGGEGGDGGGIEGMDVLLQQLAAYKRHDPSTREEAEMMYNLFDCLCYSLMLAPNKDKFLRGEGVQLMNLMLRYIGKLVLTERLRYGFASRMANPSLRGVLGAPACSVYQIHCREYQLNPPRRRAE